MAQSSIGEAWSQAMAFMSQHLQMLVTVVGGGALVAAVLQYLAVGGSQVQQFAAMQQAFTTGDFSQLASAGGAGALGALGFLVVITASLVQSAAQYAGMRIGLTNGQEEVGPALSYGLVASIMTILVFVAIGVVAAIVIFVPMFVLGLGAAAGGAGAGGTAAVGLLLALVLLVALVWLAARLCVFQPAMAAARSVNPLYGLGQSWRLTAGNAGGIILYLIVLLLAAIVLLLVLGGIVGAIGSLFGAFGALLLSTLFVSIPLTILSLGISVGIYRTLAPSDVSDVFS